MKQLITILVIVGSLAAAGVLIYLALTHGSSSEDSLLVPQSQSSLLPYGDTIDFSKVESYNSTGRLNTPVKVNPSEIGQPVGNILKAGK